MYQVGQVVARRMTPGEPSHVKHIAALKWQTSDVGLMWSTRDDMVKRVDKSSPGTFFTKVDGYHANVYSVHRDGRSWVQTEPDETKVDNLLHLPVE